MNEKKPPKIEEETSPKKLQIDANGNGFPEGFPRNDVNFHSSTSELNRLQRIKVAYGNFYPKSGHQNRKHDPKTFTPMESVSLNY